MFIPYLQIALFPADAAAQCRMTSRKNPEFKSASYLAVSLRHYCSPPPRGSVVSSSKYLGRRRRRRNRSLKTVADIW
jgi:hypothetical protein